MMQGVRFGNKHSFNQWQLMLKSRPVISPPVPKTKYVDVPGANGSIDLTESLTGYTQYKNRKISFEFVMMAGRTEWPAIYSDIMDALHGKTMEIIFDDDPAYFYKGRVTVGEWDAKNAKVAILTMTADVEPFKTAVTPTRRTLSVNGAQTVTVTLNTPKPVVPTFTISTSSGVYVTFNGKSSSLPYTDGNSAWYDPAIVMRSGQTNTFTLTGTGTVSINYREGRL